MDFLGIIEDLKREISNLKQENAALRQENASLKERLGLNSKNSSLPPSRDLYRTSRKNRLGSGRKPGGQPGHKPQGYQLQMPDEVIDVFPEYCSCGHPLEVAQNFRIDQKMEIPPIKPYVTEYHLYQGICRSCGKKKTASLPTGIQQDLLGDHAKAIISALSGFFHNSKRDVHQILQDIFHLPISLGLVSMSEKRVSKKLTSFYQDSMSQIEDSAYYYSCNFIAHG